MGLSHKLWFGIIVVEGHVLDGTVRESHSTYLPQRYFFFNQTLRANYKAKKINTQSGCPESFELDNVTMRPWDLQTQGIPLKELLFWQWSLIVWPWDNNWNLRAERSNFFDHAPLLLKRINKKFWSHSQYVYVYKLYAVLYTIIHIKRISM